MAFYSKDTAATITIELNNGSSKIYEVKREAIDIEQISIKDMRI